MGGWKVHWGVLPIGQLLTNAGKVLGCFARRNCAITFPKIRPWNRSQSDHLSIDFKTHLILSFEPQLTPNLDRDRNLRAGAYASLR